MVEITIIGSLNYDLVTFTKKVPDAGETFQANSFENHLGGKGLNEALAVSRLTGKNQSINVRMIGNVGDDSFGKELKQSLVDQGVDTTHIKTLKGISSGVAVIMVEENGENRILITAGANGELKPSDEDYKHYFPRNERGNFVVLQNEYPDTAKTVEWLKHNRPEINIAYNPSPFKPEILDKRFLGYIDLLIVNEGEALDVATNLLPPKDHEIFQDTIKNDRIDGFQKVAEKLRTMLNQENVCIVIITMGSLGSIVTSKSSESTFHKSRKVKEVVDTTGAGDTFFGAVVSQLALGSDIDRAITFATVASSLTIQKKGAAESIPTFDIVSSNL